MYEHLMQIFANLSHASATSVIDFAEKNWSSIKSWKYWYKTKGTVINSTPYSLLTFY